MIRFAAILATGVLLGACGRSSTESAPQASASAPPAASVAPASVPSARTQSLSGSYKTSPGAVAVGSAFPKARWASAESSAGVGEGKIAMVIDEATGRVHGTMDGAVGAAVLDGVLAGHELTTSVRRKDPTDRGLTGTLSGSWTDGRVAGTLSLASAEGGLVRTGTFSLAPDTGR